MISRQSQRRGVAMLMAVLLLSLVAMAVLALAARLNYDARRTRQGAREAQLRQMLLAGASEARAQAGQITGPGRQWEVALPAELGSGSVRVAARKQGDAVETRITATLDGKMREQTVRWARDGTGWRVVSVALGDEHVQDPKAEQGAP